MADNSIKEVVKETRAVSTSQVKRNVVSASKRAAQEAARIKVFDYIDDEANLETVEVPATDLFDKPFLGVSINFETYGPGKHTVNPEIAGEIKRLLKAASLADMRVYRPTQDKKMLEIMAKNGKPLTTAGVGVNVGDFSASEYLAK